MIPSNVFSSVRNSRMQIPLHERWNLADMPESYCWSSASYYETNKNDFGFLTNLNEAFDLNFAL